MTERAGYTVTMFLIDVSPSMGTLREVEVPDGLTGEVRTIETTNLEWSLQFVKLKIQEMIYNGRKTDQCGVILFGSEETNNIINDKDGGYEHVSEYIPIGQPNANTLAKLSALQASEEHGDPIDAIIVGIETQERYLANKKKWTRKMILLTDGESPIEIEDWEATTRKMNNLNVSLTIVGVDFDDDEIDFHDEKKSDIKRANEEFYHKFVEQLDVGIVGNCEFALEEVARPDVKQVKSALLGTELRIGDTKDHPLESIIIRAKTSKCTALMRPKSWKKFAARPRPVSEDVEMTEEGEYVEYTPLIMRTQFYLDHRAEGEEEEAAAPQEESETEDEEEAAAKTDKLQVIEKEELVRGYKYGSSFVPTAEEFPRLRTEKGIDICGFFHQRNFRREWPMGEVQYVWADPEKPLDQAALSSIVQAMYEKGYMAIARWVSRDNMDPKMGVLSPTVFDGVDCFLWAQMPFADDVRKYTFASLDKLINKKGELITKHPYLPTEQQLDAMEKLVDAMDLMDAGEKDEQGNRNPWFDTRLSYNPAIHRTKHAQFHAAVVKDLDTHPLPPPHPELTKYFEPPRRVRKRARHAIEECKNVFKVKEVPKRVSKLRKDGHVRALEDEEEPLLLEKLQRRQSQLKSTQSQARFRATISPKSQRRTQKKYINSDDSATEPESETETEDEDYILLDKEVGGPSKITDEEGKEKEPSPLLTPTSKRSISLELEPDLGREPGRIIGLAYPLTDFKKNIVGGDLVSKAVEDLAWVIKSVVQKPFTWKRSEEMLGCMKELRKVALQEDEIDAWNEFLRDLRKTCLEDEPGNKQFWSDATALGRGISLISKSEASKEGGRSNISDATAAEFIRSP
ncbi:unnamed protein product [Somion occarium]|uniref:ATP-dependent DNA helicase II subunit 2 n=1 Tax=Somion occarium TaxID=3059160 RepID=A0ABP1CRQ3_9APHY